MVSRGLSIAVVLLGLAMIAGGAAIALFAWATVPGLALVTTNQIAQADTVRAANGATWGGLIMIAAGGATLGLGGVLYGLVPWIMDLRAAQPKKVAPRRGFGGWTKWALLRLLVIVATVFPTVATVYELFAEDRSAAAVTILLCLVMTLALYVAWLAGGAQLTKQANETIQDERRA